MIVDPEGHAFDMAAMRFPNGVDSKQERLRAISSLKTLNKLVDEFNTTDVKIEIKLIDYLLEYSSLIVNLNDLDCKLYIERYTFRIYGGSKKPKFVLNRNSGEWFNLFNHEINSIWALGKPYDKDSLK